MTSERNIKVYCPEHSVAFEASAGAPIHCKNKHDEHLLTQNFPPDNIWEYCCDCDRFYPFQLANDDRRQRNLDIEECVNCKRHAIRRFLCDQCNVVSVESGEKGEKSYCITGTGLVRLAKGPTRHECPSCLKSPQIGSISEHHCKKLDVTFTTARDECPFCGMDIQPQLSGPFEQPKVNGETYTTPLTTEPPPFESTSGAENDPKMASAVNAEPEADSIPASSAAQRAKHIGVAFIILARKHSAATLAILSVLLGIVALLLSPSIRAHLNHTPHVDNIVVSPPVIAPGKSVSLIGVASDQDGDLLTYQWSCSCGKVIEWNNQYAQLKLDDPELSSHGAKIAVHLQVIDPYGEMGNGYADINVEPPPPNLPPTLSLVADKQVATAGEKVILKAEASDKDDQNLSFKWSCANYADALSGDGNQVTLDTSKIKVSSAPVLLTVSSIVNDDHGNSTSDKIPILIVSKLFNRRTVARLATRTINHPFTLSLSGAEKSWVYAGERLKLVGNAIAPHIGDGLTYQWAATNGCAIEGTGSEVWLSTAVLNPQVDLVVVQVNLIVRDQHGGSIKGSIKIFVLPKPTSRPPVVLPSGTPISNG